MSSIFGGGTSSSSKASQQAQLGENRKVQQFIEQQQRQNRGDITGATPEILAMQQAGNQGALDLLGQSIAPQLSAFQQGNMGAQQQLIASLGNYQNALMGAPMQAYQPMGIDADYSYLQDVQLAMPPEPTPAQPNTPTYTPSRSNNYGGTNYGFGGGRGLFNYDGRTNSEFL